MICECGHAEGAHGPRGCVDWDVGEKRRCHCETYVAASAPDNRAAPPARLVVDEPSDEQLCNVAVLVGFPMLATPILRSLPHWRPAMLNLHRLLKRTLDGDRDAERKLQLLVDAFATTGELPA